MDPSIEEANACPITDIKVVSADEVSAIKEAGYTVRKFGGHNLAFSRMTDSKPLTTMKLTTSQPCLNPLEQPYSSERQYLIGEIGRQGSQCTQVRNLIGEPQTLDSRYK